MKLEHWNGITRPTPWVIIDDFGGEHDLLDGIGDFGGGAGLAYQNQYPIKRSRLEDPDFCRAHFTRPQPFFVRESSTFASPFGISLELPLRVDFTLHPFWDDEAGEPRWTQAEGATVEIQVARVDDFDVYPASTVLVRAALEAFCWAYIDLEKAREKERLAKLEAETSHA